MSKPYIFVESNFVKLKFKEESLTIPKLILCTHSKYFSDLEREGNLDKEVDLTFTNFNPVDVEILFAATTIFYNSDLRQEFIDYCNEHGTEHKMGTLKEVADYFWMEIDVYDTLKDILMDGA